MLYMVGKILLYGVRFEIVHNEWSSEKYEHFRSTFFLQGSANNIKVLETGLFK